MSVSALVAASSGAAFPQLPSAESAEIFAELRKAPRLDAEGSDWAFRPVAEFHATNDRSTFDAGGETQRRWKVYGGSSFNLWEPETGDVYAWAEPRTVTEYLFEKRKRQANLSSSAFFGSSQAEISSSKTLPCFRPRIAFRDVTNATNTRTVIAALVPGNTVLTNKAPYLLRRAGSEQHEAFLLGVMCSIPLDWYARRFVELGLNLHILNGLPIPRPVPGCPISREVISIAGRLAARDERFEGWAKAVGVPVGSVKDDRTQADLEARLDALVARMYGLSANQLQHIYETFHRGWDYKSRLSTAHKHFLALKPRSNNG